MTFEVGVAAAFAVGAYGLLTALELVRGRRDLEDLSPLARRAREFPWPVRGLVQSVLYLCIGITGELWATDVLLPAVRAGGVVLVWTIARDVVTGGLAVSLGHQLKSRSYSVFGGGGE